MRIIKIDNWTDFKQVALERSAHPQWSKIGDMYYIDFKDGYRLFTLDLDNDGGYEVLDFEANYKNIWNAKLEYRDGIGLPRVHTSPRPDGTVTYFSGAGDDQSAGDGERLIFNMLSTDSSKSKTISFNENVHIKDGIAITHDAPIGSKLDIEVLDPNDNPVMSFVKSYNLLGTGPIYLNSEDQEKLSSILKLRVTVYNSVSGQPDHEAPKNFKLIGNFESYRITTT